MPKHSPYYFLAEPLLEHPSLLERRMFGCDAFYLHGRLQLVLCDGSTTPWKGILVATDKSQHAALVAEFPLLSPHPVLGKWLYLPDDEEQFEQIGQALVECILRNDTRIGVEPSSKEPRSKKPNRNKSATRKRSKLQTGVIVSLAPPA